MYTIKQCNNIPDKHVVYDLREKPFKAGFIKKKFWISVQNGWNWSKEAITERRSIVWLSEEKISSIKFFPLCFVQGTSIGLFCHSVNSLMHESVFEDPEKINL